MKKVFSLLSLSLVLTVVLAQKKDVEVFEKKEGNTVLVMARNTGKVDYAVTLTITATGMDVKPSMKVESIIPAGFMKEMANLTPKPGESWEYGYQVSFVQSAGKTTTTSSTPTTQESQTVTSPTPTATSNVTTPTSPQTAQLSQADIIVYTKPGCSRCEFTKKELNSQGIKYEEYSTATNSPEINNMWAGLRNSGFTGGSVTMPVVRANGKYYYNIQDLGGFVAKLKKS